MGNHIDTRSPRRQKVREHDEMARRRRASFKQYLQQLEEDLLDEELDETDISEDDQDE